MANGPFYAEGTYVGEVISTAMTVAKTGTPQFAVRFKVLGHPDPKNPENYLTDVQQFERTMYRPITEKTIDYVSEDLQTMGFTGSSFSDLEKTDEFNGKLFDFYCKHEVGQDQQRREKWSLSRGPAEFNPDPLPPAEIRKLDAMFGKNLRKQDKPKVPRPTPINQSEVGDDDLAF